MSTERRSPNMRLEHRARALAAADWLAIVAEPEMDDEFFINYPVIAGYVNEWWQERYMYEAQKQLGTKYVETDD